MVAHHRPRPGNRTLSGIPIPSGWVQQRLDTFGTAGSVPGSVRLGSLYYESLFWLADGSNRNRVTIPNLGINNQQQEYEHFEDATWSHMSDRLRIQGRGQGSGVIKAGQIVSKKTARSFMFEARITLPATLGTWSSFWAYASTGGNDTSELDFELLMSVDGATYGVHNVSMNNHPYAAPSGNPVSDDSHFSFNSSTGLLFYDNAAFDKTTAPHYYTIYYDDTGGGTVRRYIDGVLIYHFPNWKWNNSLGGTGNGPDACAILDLSCGSGATGGQFPGTIASPSTWTGDLDIYSIGYYGPGSVDRAIPVGEAWNYNLKTASITLSGSDLIATATATASAIVYALDAMYSGKYYWEVILSSNNAAAGVGGQGNYGLTTYLGDSGHGIGWYGAGGWAGSVAYQNAVVATWGVYSGTSIRLCFALHIVPGGVCKLWGRIGAAGNWNNDVISNQNPANDTGGYTLPFTVGILPAANTGVSGDTATMVAASGSWAGTAPSGYGQIGPT